MSCFGDGFNGVGGSDNGRETRRRVFFKYPLYDFFEAAFAS